MGRYSIWKKLSNSRFSFPSFPCFSTMELTSPCKNSEFGHLSIFIDFLHYFTLFGIDMHNIYHISSISSTFGPLWNMGFSGPDPNLHLALCHMKINKYTNTQIHCCSSPIRAAGYTNTAARGVQVSWQQLQDQVWDDASGSTPVPDIGRRSKTRLRTMVRNSDLKV